MSRSIKNNIKKNRWILLTGLSGSGKTSALKILEDQGFAAIDNLPVALLPTLLPFLQKDQKKNFKLVLGMDARGPDFIRLHQKVIDEFEEIGSQPEILFFECSEKVLIQRFSETRRPHPLKKSRETLAKTIQREARELAPLRKQATKIFNTSRLSVHQLKQTIHKYLSIKDKLITMTLTLLSFGFRYGTPIESDMTFDVRFLPNPYFTPRLRKRVGTNLSVKNFLKKQKDTGIFLKKTMGLFKFLIPRFQQEGKSHLTIAIGCTGGKHRSVGIVEMLGETLTLNNIEIIKIHRDISKE